jgi:hypothetical protein
MLVITPTFTAGFNDHFGSNAAAAQAAWRAAAQIFTANFTDNIHVNIKVDAVGDRSIFGHSNYSLPHSIPYANLRARMVADARSHNDSVALGAGGSLTAADPTNGHGQYLLTRAQAKALGLLPDDLLEDGVTTFGAGFPFTFSGPIAPGTFDFHGIAAHEISEVLGRVGFQGKLNGTPNCFSLLDLFSYTAPGKRDMVGGRGNHFSIDNGTTLLKSFTDVVANPGDDTRDWAPGSNDAFNDQSSGSVSNPVSLVDLLLMDVIGYDLVPVPAKATPLASAGEGTGGIRPGKN